MSTLPFGIYVHWPFCQAKCPYCDFNSHVAARIDHDAFAEAYEKAIDAQGHIGQGRALNSVYFGGGTPSTAAPKTIARILDRLAKHWQITPETEITLEANPTSVEAEKFTAFRDAGINRVSLGFQSFRDDGLKQLGRLHSVTESLQALDIARKYFDRVNFDLIYARQYQSLADWQSELEDALKFAPEHLSLYQLGIEEGTAFGRLQKAGKLGGLPSDDLGAEMFEWTSAEMESRGFEHYEISNFARKEEGKNARSRHNMLYWQYGEYLGIGAGAHGRYLGGNVPRVATEQQRRPWKWLENPTEFNEFPISPKEACEEYLLNALRISDGAEFARIEEFGNDINHIARAELTEQGYLWQSNSHFGATKSGRLLLNQILVALFPE